MPKKKGTRSRKAKAEKSAGGQASPAVEQQRALQASPSSQTDTLRLLYAGLLRCRRVQEWLGSAETAVIGDHALGHEAVAVGAIAELTAGDTLAASPGHTAALLAKGAPIRNLLGNGVSADGFAWSKPYVPEDPFHGGVGIALAHKLEQKRGVVLAVCAQRQPFVGNWRDALQFAVSHRLPIIFVIENPMQAHDADAEHLATVSFMVRDHDFPGILVDGSDVVAVWRVVQESVHRARQGLGPTLIDCRTDHERDPLAHMERYLRNRKLWDEHWKQQLERDVATEIQQALT